MIRDQTRNGINTEREGQRENIEREIGIVRQRARDRPISVSTVLCREVKKNAKPANSLKCIFYSN